MDTERIQSLELEYQYAVAGLRVLTNRPLQLDGNHTGTDGQVSVVFSSGDANLKKLVDTFNWPTYREDWYPLVSYGGIKTVTNKDGQVLLVFGSSNLAVDSGALLRMLIPYVSAFQKKLVLHASAVRTGQGIAVFIGASGVGKSTVARHLVDMGFPPVSDDLLPCRVCDQRVLVPLAKDSSALHSQLPLDRIYFISRDSSSKHPEVLTLNKMEQLRLLLRNGFGELPYTRIWKFQFEEYGKIVDLVPAFQLTLPDGIEHLQAAVEKLVDSPSPDGRHPISIPQIEPLKR